jgi:hypothetical protein
MKQHTLHYMRYLSEIKNENCYLIKEVDEGVSSSDSAES